MSTTTELAELNELSGRLQHTVMSLRARYGDKVRTRLITPQRGLFGRRVPGVSSGLIDGALAGIGEAGLNALDERALWSRYGL